MQCLWTLLVKEILFVKSPTVWAGDLAQQLRAFAAFLEDLGLILSIHMVAHDHW